MLEDGDRPDEAQPVQTGKLKPESSDRARISRDMEGIFGAPVDRGPAKGVPAADGIEPLVAPRPSAKRPKATGAPLLLAFGALIGGGLAWMALSSPNPTPAPAYRVITVPAARTVEPVAASPALASPAGRQPAPLPEPVSIVPALESDPDKGTAANAPTVLPKRATVTRTAYHPARNAVQRAPRSRAPRADRREPCASMRGLWRARCMRPQVVAADRRLRNAYDDAVRAGVDRQMLVAYRNRWNRIRADAVSDPTYVTAAFDDMARRLDAARADADRAEF